MNIQNLAIVAGDDATLVLTAKDGSQRVKNLTGGTITWALARFLGETAVLSKAGAIVSAAAGTFSIALTDSDTFNLSGEYVQQAKLTVAGVTTTVVQGRVVVTEKIIVGTGGDDDDQQAQAIVGLIPTRDDVTTRHIDSALQFIITGGYAAVGDDGCATYIRVADEPAHAGKIQDAAGVWWELAETEVCPEMFGAIGDGATDDADALTAAFGYMLAKDRAVLLHPKEYGIGSTLTINLPGLVSVTGPRVRGTFNRTVLKAIDGAEGPMFRIRGVPPDGTSVSTRFFQSGYFHDFEIDGSDGGVEGYVGIEVSAWSFFHWRGLTVTHCSGAGVVTKIQTGYSTNPDYSAPSNGLIENCLIQDNLFGWMDTSLLCAPAMCFYNTYVNGNFNGGLRCLSSHWQIVQSTIAFNGVSNSRGINPGVVAGLEIGSIDLGGTIENITLDTIEFDENKSAHVVIDNCRSVSFEKCRALFQDVFVPGTNWPSIHVQLGNNSSSIVEGIRDRFTRYRVVAPSPVSGYYVVDPSQVVGIDVADYETQLEAGASISLADGFMGANGNNRRNNYRMVHKDGTITLPGKNDPVFGRVTFAAATHADVTLAFDEPDNAYMVVVMALSQDDYWISNRTTTGFRINCAGALSTDVLWRVLRNS